jgi:hypothetical protein
VPTIKSAGLHFVSELRNRSYPAEILLFQVSYWPRVGENADGSLPINVQVLDNLDARSFPEARDLVMNVLTGDERIDLSQKP